MMVLYLLNSLPLFHFQEERFRDKPFGLQDNDLLGCLPEL